MRLLIMGNVRVGTLHDFRRSEHKRGISDSQEGKKIVSHHIKDLHVANSNAVSNEDSVDFRALSAFNAVQLNDSRNVTFKNVRVSREFDSPDYFVYCVSAVNSRKTMNEFGGADSCLEIFDASSFYRLLTETLNQITPVEFLGLHHILYKDRTEVWNGNDWGNHPVLIKDCSFKSQGEIRAIWRPRFGQTIQPVITGHHLLGRSCCITTCP